MSEGWMFILFAVAVTAGVLMMVWPVWQASKDEEQQRPRQSTAALVSWASTLGVPVLALLVYMAAGNPAALSPPTPDEALAAPQGMLINPATRERMPMAWAVAGQVVVAPTLKGKVPSQAMLLVYAKSLDGNPMPLAVYRTEIDAWPVAFRLDHSLAMTPDRDLQDHPVVNLYARLSATGQAKAAPGDLEGELAAVQANGEPLRLVLDRLR